VGRLLGLWCHCGGELKISRGAPGGRQKGEITGPLFRFLQEATKPIFLVYGRPPLSAVQFLHLINKMRAEERS
jgi:hypothetical protein